MIAHPYSSYPLPHYHSEAISGYGSEGQQGAVFETFLSEKTLKCVQKNKNVCISGVLGNPRKTPYYNSKAGFSQLLSLKLHGHVTCLEVSGIDIAPS